MLRSKYVPVSVAWELTLQCNLRCIHCGSSAGIVRSNELTTDESLDLCKNLSDLDVQLLTFTGGEPLLRKDWFEIGKRIRDYGIDLSIISNGYILDEKTVFQLRKLDPYTVAISLDGAYAETHDSIRKIKGSFNKCMEVLKLLKDNNIPSTVVTTVHKNNLTELPKIRDFLLDKNIAWQIQMATPIGRFPKDLILNKEEFYSISMFIASSRNMYSKKRLPLLGAHSIGYNSKILRNTMLMPLWKGCQAGISTLGILSDGGIKGCMSLPESFVEDNIRNRDIKDIWNDPEMFSYNRKFTKNDLNGDCKNCKHGKTCKGGCLTVSTALTGLNHCDPYCLYLIEKEKILS